MKDMAFEQAHVWHPYTERARPQRLHRIVAAEGIWLTRDDGGRMIDAMSSWWAAAFGHAPAPLVQALKDQAEVLPHVMFAGLTHQPVIDLTRQLVAAMPAGLDQIFYSDSGSVAVEVAVKMAAQSQVNRGHPHRTDLATARGGYHGDTWKAMSLSDPETGMHAQFGRALSAQHFVPRPPISFDAQWSEDPVRNGLAEVETLFRTHGDRIAAFIIEPVVQGAGGMHFHHPGYLRGLRALCDHFGIHLIFDEIATGFSRTGADFAMETAGVTPDILCLGKALTGGMMTLAATITTKELAATVGALMHGPTFMANPLACAVASAAMDLWKGRDWSARARAIETQLATELAPARAMTGVRDLRTLGAIGVIEMEAPLPVGRVHRFCMESGVWLRPLGRLLYAMPPLSIEPDELSCVTHAMLTIAKGL
ncbi:adenosylmethionine--8-amino-7-oxononanoate transaminase [Thioclava nitratireducens]|uniref:adenosylmethionine--8-amino-7-oxononanoate transaminase n=1 Tax=Thioclava nitratireducens TaxID=1915078 RepID=UPI002480A19D|nr:adenosylmethionine--8-amino-7-oxononanoate transaminase [Thioclava nitratireducens]WGT51548.1 adenosylmethionine--8-amino-7-oxononanoate transaminase [Thioclava nitratireducens]